MASVIVPLAEGCEELEAITILDLLVRAGVTVVSAGLNSGPVKCARGTVIVPDMTLDDALKQDYDMMVLPGGLPGADHLMQDKRIQQRLKEMNSRNEFIAAICAAPKVLASAGLLTNKKVTCYPGTLDAFDIEGLQVSENAIEKDGNVITSRGPGTAMDFTLHLIEVLTSAANRKEVERALKR